MRERVTITNRGVVTIPANMRRAFGLKAGEDLIAEETADGILLRPAVSVPVELYTEERIAEFASDDDVIAKQLDALS